MTIALRRLRQRRTVPITRRMEPLHATLAGAPASSAPAEHGGEAPVAVSGDAASREGVCRRA
jgi:hypothetical protein